LEASAQPIPFQGKPIMRGLLSAALGLLWLFASTNSASALSFSSATQAVGTQPFSVAIGDLSSDGKPDLATANFGSDNVTVLLGNGSGGYSAASGGPFAVGSRPHSVVARDLNSDGKPDLATANNYSNNVTLLLGDGSGGFAEAPGSPFAVGSAPTTLAIRDLNRDGKPDLATANEWSDNVTVLIGDGSGGFSAAPASPFMVGVHPTFIVSGDVNGDGTPDLATANRDSNDTTVLAGDGSGGFTEVSGSPFAVGSAPHSVAIGDLNSDGRLDLATGNQVTDDVTVLLGDGSGGFSAAPGSPFAVGDLPTAIAIGDVNSDGKPDLATADRTANDVTVLLRDGSGGFSAAPGSPFMVGTRPRSITVADLNTDGKLDLATPNENSDDVTVLLNTSQRSVATKSYQPAGYKILSGSVYKGGGSISRLSANDGSRLDISAAKSGSSYYADLYAYASIAPAERNSLSKLTADYDGNVSSAAAALTLQAYDFTAAAWTTASGPRTGATTDRPFSWSNSSAPTRYVSPAGQLRFRVRGTNTSWFRTRTDLIRFTIDYFAPAR
jgi:VCBS repeat protein